MTLVVIKRKWIFFIALILIILLSMIRLKQSTEPTFLPIENRVIAIDAGHGGIDPGKVGNSGITEEELNLKIALKLRKIIEQNGGIVLLTREDENGLYTEKSITVKEKKTEDLKKRRSLVDESDPDIFISIHLNSFPEEKYYGAQAFFKEGCIASEKLANDIQEEIRNIIDKENKRVPQARDSIFLIREVEKPAVLIEGGFLSNRNEERLLKSEKHQEKIAWAIYVGINKFFNEI